MTKTKAALALTIHCVLFLTVKSHAIFHMKNFYIHFLD